MCHRPWELCCLRPQSLGNWLTLVYQIELQVSGSRSKYMYYVTKESKVMGLILQCRDSMSGTLLAPCSCHVYQFTFHVSLPSLKFTTLIHFYWKGTCSFNWNWNVTVKHLMNTQHWCWILKKQCLIYSCMYFIINQLTTLLSSLSSLVIIIPSLVQSVDPKVYKKQFRNTIENNYKLLVQVLSSPSDKINYNLHPAKHQAIFSGAPKCTKHHWENTPFILLVDYWLPQVV